MKRWYAVHRWLGAIALVQLALWTVSGLFFALAPLPEVRGEDRKVATTSQPIAWERVQPLPASFRGQATRVVLAAFDGRPVYEVQSGKRTRLVDARLGTVITIDEASARRIARADQQSNPSVRSATPIARDPPIEYRDKPLPAWAVQLDDERNTRIYVDAATGRVTARRNDLWRWFDFFWSLHIMDYGERSDFNHPLLVVFAGLGVLTVLSGGTLWVVRRLRRVRKQRSGGEAEA
jgi:uncharacterized iron-regulated membrane protein